MRHNQKTHEQYVEEVKNLNKRVKVIGKYTNNCTKILHECERGHQWEVTPSKILNGRGCPYCSGKKACLDNCLVTVNPELAAQWHPTMNGNLTPFDVTLHCNKKVWWICNCENKWKASINSRSYSNNINCPKCRDFSAQTKTQDEFEYEVCNLVGVEYTVLGEYINSKTPILMKHNNDCGNEYCVRPSDFITGSRCPNCFGKFKKTTEQFKQEVYNVIGDEYTVLGEYEGANTKIKLKHNKKDCDKIFEVTPHHFLTDGSRCPFCNESKGERAIRYWLEENHIDFKSQKEFDGLIGLGGKSLSYDFLLTNLNILIEFQGEQHKRYIKGFHRNEDNFKKQQEHDKRKRQYANDNGIKLLEIWYWDFDNIEDILEKELI